MKDDASEQRNPPEVRIPTRPQEDTSAQSHNDGQSADGGEGNMFVRDNGPVDGC